MTLGERFGENLRRCRRLVDLSQEELGNLAGLHRTHIGLMEKGKRLPRMDTLVKLASTLEVKADDLLEGIVWVPKRQREGAYVLRPTEWQGPAQSGRGLDPH